MSIADRARAVREGIGISQSEVARRMNLLGWANYTQMTVSRTEKGLRTPKLDEAVDLASVLRTSLDHLAGLTSADEERSKLAEAMEQALESLRDLGLLERGEQ